MILLCMLILSNVPSFNSSEEELDSDHDGWSDEYEETIGTDPNNPDTDGDGIEDPDDPTPKGSLINDEEIWETFEVEVIPSDRFSAVGEELDILVKVKKNDVPIAGREVWLFIYLEEDGYRKVEESSKILSNGNASFTIRPGDPGDYVFLAIVNRSTVSPGYEISNSEMNQIRQKKQGGYTFFEIFPGYQVTISSSYRNILEGQKDTFFIQKWKYSKELAAEYSEPYPSLEDIYELTSGKVHVSIGNRDNENVIGTYGIRVGTEGSNWSYTFTRKGSHYIAAYPDPIDPVWIEGPYKFPYPYVRLTVHDTLISWLETPGNAGVMEEHPIKAHRVYLDPGMGPELFDQLYQEYSLPAIAEMYPQYVSPWKGNAYISILYEFDSYNYYLLLGQGTITVDGVGELSYLLDTPGDYLATLSFIRMPSFPHDQRFKRCWKYQESGDLSSRFDVRTDLVTSVFARQEMFFPGENCGISVFTMQDSGPVNSIPIALYVDDDYHTTLEPGGSGVIDHTLAGIPHGDRTVIALPLFSDNTRRIVEIMGIDLMAEDEYWIANTEVYVRNLAIYSHLPYRYVSGHEAPLQVIVYGEGFMPLEDAAIEFEFLERDWVGNILRSEILPGAWTTDASGACYPTITVPDYERYNRIVIHSKHEEITESVEYTIYVREEAIKCQFTLNKPIYRAGDTVHASFLLWSGDDLTPVISELEVRLIDPYDRTIMRDEITTNSYGHGAIDLSLPDKLPWGDYKIQLEVHGTKFSKSFELKEYDLPETTICFDEAPDETSRGENVTIPVRVEYLFGAPVTEGTVDFTVTEYHYYGHYGYYGGYSGYSYYSGDPMYYSGYDYLYMPVITMDPGEETGSFPITQSVEVESGWANLTFFVPGDAGTMTIQAEFSDRFGHSCEGNHILGTGSKVVGAELTVNLTKSTYLPDEEIPCIVSLEKEGEPISGIEVNITISARRENYTWEYHYFHETTDESGEFEFDVRDKVPYMELLRNDFLWFGVSGNVIEDPSITSETIEFLVHRYKGTVSTDRTDFTAGEEVAITFGEFDLIRQTWVRTDYKLEVIYQRPYGTDYRIYHSSIPAFVSSGTLDNEEGIVTLSIPEHMPAGTYLIKATFGNTVVEHRIQLFTKDERIEITSDAESYVAGDTISFHVHTTNASGKWVYVDVITGRSLHSYAFLPEGSGIDLTIPTLDYRHSVSVTAYFISDSGSIVSDDLSIPQTGLPEFTINLTTDEETYEPGDTAILNLTVTDGEGNLIPDLLVGLSIVDYAVFELEDDVDENPYFSLFRSPSYQERDNRLRANFVYLCWSPEELENHSESYWPDEDDDVEIYDEDFYRIGGITYDLYESSKNSAIDGLEFSMPGEATLGGGLSQALEETDLRSDFRETAFWLPGFEMENGTYSWEITLPDNLAKWRVKALAITETCLGAMDTFEFNTSKDFFVDVDIPPRVTQDDEFTLVSRIHNFNDEELDVEIGLTAGPWLNVFGENEKEFSLPAGSVREIEFRVKVLEPGVHNLTIIATDYGTNTDAIRRDMMVRPNGALKTTHITGSVEDNETMEFEFLPELVNGSENVVLRLAVGYEGLLDEGMRMLKGYPYDCTEQVMSVLLPNALLYDHLRMTGELTPYLRRQLEWNIYKGIMKLLANQHSDGGWGWWKGDRTDAFMTAYVLFGLSVIEDIGLCVDRDIIEGAQESLMERRNEEGIWSPTHWMGENHIVMTLYVSHSLVLSGYDRDRLVSTLASLHRAWNEGEIDDPYEMSLYTLLLQELGEDESEVVDALVGSLTVSHWQAGSSLGGGDETTAWAAYALWRTGTHRDIVRGSLEWLAGQRSPSGGWGTTSDTIAALILINEVIKTSEKPDMNVTVKMNGETLVSLHVDHTYESRHEFRSALDALNLIDHLYKEETNRITIERTGTGDLFYELTTIQYLRKGIELEYTGNITAEEGETFEIEVKVRPDGSGNVNIAGLDVLLPEPVSLLLLSSNYNGTGDEMRTYTFSYLAREAGDYVLGPIIVSYSVEAGERPSATIREYFKGFSVTVGSENTGTTRGESSTGNGKDGTEPDGMDPGGTELDGNGQGGTEPDGTEPEGMVSLVKIITGSPAVIGEPVEVRVIASIPEELIDEDLRIEDTIPDGFTASGDVPGIGNGRIVIETIATSVIEFSYILTTEKEYHGSLPRALIYKENWLMAYSNLPAFRVIRDDDIAIERIYSTSSSNLNEPVSVSLFLRAPEGLTYAAVEDTLPPGCRILEDSVEANLDENVQSHTIAGDKVVFFISEVTELSLQYQFIPTIVGEFAVPPAEMYSMYETGRRADSSSDYLVVNEPGETGIDVEDARTDLTIFIKEEAIPEKITEGEEIVFEVTIYNLGPQDVQSVPIGLYVDDKIVWRDCISIPFYSIKVVRIPWIPQGGEHTITIVVDDLEMVEETNEENNAVEFSVRIIDKKGHDDDTNGMILFLMGIVMIAMTALTIHFGRTAKGKKAMMRRG